MERVGTAEQGSRVRKQLRHRPLGESNRVLLRTYTVLTTRAQKAQWEWQCPDHWGWKGKPSRTGRDISQRAKGRWKSIERGKDLVQFVFLLAHSDFNKEKGLGGPKPAVWESC